MKQYHDLMRRVLDTGEDVIDRTGVGTRKVFGAQMRFDMADGYPLLTTKRVHFPSIIHELIWFMRGDTNIKYLEDNGIRIWREWAKPNGDLGPIYGEQWRSAGRNGDIDQLMDCIDDIRYNPHSRRMIVESWQVDDIPMMQLPPCHHGFQFVVRGDRLNIHVTQRSVDVMLGLPFNLASYSALLHVICHMTGYYPGEIIWNGVDVHIYRNHIEQCKLQLTRDERPLPKLEIIGPVRDDPGDYTFEQFKLENYNPHPTIKAKVAV